VRVPAAHVDEAEVIAVAHQPRHAARFQLEALGVDGVAAGGVHLGHVLGRAAPRRAPSKPSATRAGQRGARGTSPRDDLALARVARLGHDVERAPLAALGGAAQTSGSWSVKAMGVAP
jgi:hypothetical protein